MGAEEKYRLISTWTLASPPTMKNRPAKIWLPVSQTSSNPHSLRRNVMHDKVPYDIYVNDPAPFRMSDRPHLKSRPSINCLEDILVGQQVISSKQDPRS